jgi:hypothetical protein
VEIERRVNNGLLGTGFGAKWETLPVEAWQQIGRDGSVDTVINHEQLNKALGRSAPTGSKDAATSAMVQPPKDSEPPPPQPTGTGSEETNQLGVGKRPAVEALAPSRIDAKVLEEAKQRDPEEERVLACRRVRAMPGQPAPPGQYDGPGGVDTAVGIRVAPGFPPPKGGYDYRPDYLRHFNGYKGELELKNRIEKAVPYEKIVHYGNPAGEHGPDVMTIGPKGRFMEWNSRWSQAARRITRPAIPSVKYAQADGYVLEAVKSGALSADDGRVALGELSAGNYDVCTVGTGNASDGYFEAVRNHARTGHQR